MLTIVFAVLTVSQEKQWRNDATVFTIAHELAPHNGPVARNLANTRVQAALQLDEEGRCSEAMPVFEQVTRDYPQDWYAWVGLGDCFVQLNDLPRAEESLHRAADLSHEPRVIHSGRNCAPTWDFQVPSHRIEAAPLDLLGMTCNPIGGLVQIPGIERNAMRSVKAINACRIAMRETDEHKVSLDQVIATMYQTRMDMQSRYKETSLAGLVVNVIEC